MFLAEETVELEKVLHVGQIVEVRGSGESLTCARLASVDARTFALAPAAEGDEATSLRPGQRVLLKLLTEQGVYSCETVVTELAAERVVVRKPSRFERVQRREYLRIPGLLSAMFSYRSTPIDATRNVRCTTIDISAGGLRLRPEAPMARPPKVGLHAELALSLDPAEPPVRTRCRVIRFHADGGEFIVQFVALADKERARITRYVNLRQVELSKKR